MARLTQLDDVLFPVSAHPIFVNVKTPSGERCITAPDKKAIVHGGTGRVLGIVSRRYELVSNHQALEWALQCCRVVFPETNSGEWGVRAIDAPSTAGHCCIDLVHNLATLNFSFASPHGRPDVFGPFIRVTNSYNGLRALAFDVGFARMVCSNGVILPEEVIKFKFIHSRRDIGEAIRFDIARDRLVKLKASFGGYILALRACIVPHKDIEPFVRGVLGLQPPDRLKRSMREADDWKTLSAHVSGLCNRYAAELGDNAYAVFNSVTEFASHPPANRLVRRERHSLQLLAGEWVSGFSQQCRQPGFNLTAYLATLSAPKDHKPHAEQTVKLRSAGDRYS